MYRKMMLAWRLNACFENARLAISILTQTAVKLGEDFKLHHFSIADFFG